MIEMSIDWTILWAIVFGIIGGNLLVWVWKQFRHWWRVKHFSWDELNEGAFLTIVTAKTPVPANQNYIMMSPGDFSKLSRGDLLYCDEEILLVSFSNTSRLPFEDGLVTVPVQRGYGNTPVKDHKVRAKFSIFSAALQGIQ